MKSIYFYIILIIYSICAPNNSYSYEEEKKVNGIANPYHFIKLNSQITGKIKEIRYHDGDVVNKDDIIVLLDDELQSIVVKYASLESNSEARVKSAELKFHESKFALKRLTNAFKKNAAGEWEVRQAELQMRLAEMAIRFEKEEKEKAQVKLLEEQARLDMHFIKAPVAGIIRRIHVEPGQTVSPGDPMIEFADFSSLKAEFFLPISWFDKMRSKTDYELFAGEPFNRVLKGRLELADPIFDAASRTFRAGFRIDNHDLSLPAGFPVSFSIKGDAP